MRATELTEKAATEQGFSRYENHFTFYISHRVEHPKMVHCHARVGPQKPSDPLRARIGVTSCEMVDQPHDSHRNNVRVFPHKSYVDPSYRSFGVLSAMYDHLGRHGFVVYPASGEIGDPLLQAQSEDAKAFWSKRTSTKEKSLTPISEAEFWGWREFNPFARADQVGPQEVIEKINIHGHANPMLVLWEKDYKGGPQKVGVIYDPERGYRPIVLVKHPRWGETAEIVFIRDRHIHFYHRYLDRIVKAGTQNNLLWVQELIDSL